nr:hypothetical protein [Tanacetum cinerariifolium]
ARIAQSSALPHVEDETASPLRDVSQGEACPTNSGFEADQDRANIAKTYTLPHESTSRVTSLAADEGSMQHKLDELTALCTSLQRQQSEMVSRGVAEHSGDDAPIKGKRLDVGEEATERVSDDTAEMAIVLTSMDATTVLASRVAEVPTGSGSIPTAGPPAAEVPTGITPCTRRKEKEKMIESETPKKKKKKIQEQIDIQMARQLEEEMERDAQRMNEQIARDAEVARIHAEEKLQMMINSLDRSNETVFKYLQEYKQFAEDLSIGERIENFIPMGSKEEAERFKRKGIRFEQESVKKLKTSEEVKASEEVPEEKVKEIMQLVPIEEVYVKALQVKHPIIDWKVHTEGHRNYWKIIRLGGSSASYQFFVDLLKHLDREDLNQLWALVKESLNIRPGSSDKEIELWVELKRLYKPDVEDQLWTHTQNMMHAPVEWKMYDSCGVHYVTSKDNEIFMLIEKDYPLRKGLAIVMISYKLQVENYSQMTNYLILKIYKIANCPSQKDD